MNTCKNGVICQSYMFQSCVHVENKVILSFILCLLGNKNMYLWAFSSFSSIVMIMYESLTQTALNSDLRLRNKSISVQRTSYRLWENTHSDEICFRPTIQEQFTKSFFWQQLRKSWHRFLCSSKWRKRCRCHAINLVVTLPRKRLVVYNQKKRIKSGPGFSLLHSHREQMLFMNGKIFPSIYFLQLGQWSNSQELIIT